MIVKKKIQPAKSKIAGLTDLQSTGQAIKVFDLETESKFINKNLTTLGRVFGILSNRKLQTK
jgi:hypothetical protein